MMLTSRQRLCFPAAEKDWFDQRSGEFEFYVLIKVRVPYFVELVALMLPT